MEDEILRQVLGRIIEGGGFGWGFLSGSIVMLIFRETVVKFIVKKIFKWKNGQNGKK